MGPAVADPRLIRNSVQDQGVQWLMDRLPQFNTYTEAIDEGRGSEVATAIRKLAEEIKNEIG